MRNFVLTIFVLCFIIFANGLMAQTTNSPNSNETAEEKESANNSLPTEELDAAELEKGSVDTMIVADPISNDEDGSNPIDEEKANENNEPINTDEDD